MATGVVGYLNMLPFFFDNSDLCFVSKSPSELNRLLSLGQLGAGCVSNISGLRNGLKLVEPVMGVSCLGPVKSVYLEPLISCPADVEFWNRFIKKQPIEAGSISKIEILTSGASEQSLWLSQMLFSLQGLSSAVTVIEGIDSRSQAELLNIRTQDPTHARVLLSIGDPALNRLTIFPDALRLDLSQLWFERTGLPCVFAAWYESNSGSAQQDQIRIETQKRRQSALRWGQLSTNSKKAHIQTFFGQEQLSEVALEIHCKYLSNIRYLFGEAEIQCLKLFEQLSIQYPGVVC